MAKCHSCSKVINKKSTVLECCRCQKVVHVTTICSGLSSKQLTALKSAENIDWICNECSLNSSRRKSVITLADQESDNEDDVIEAEAPFDMKQVMEDLKKEVRNIITQEIRSITNSLQYCSEKVDEFSECIDALTNNVKDMEKKITHLDNQNKSCLLKIDVLEQRNVELEQQLLGDHIEISGIPDSIDMDLPKIVEKIVDKLGAPIGDILSVKRLPSRRAGVGAAHVRVRQESTRQQLMSAARNVIITAKELVPNLSGAPAAEKIYVRGALTPYLKNLLWHAKQELKGIFKFIWIKEGKVLVRKTDTAKVFRVRSKPDIQNLLSNLN